MRPMPSYQFEIDVDRSPRHPATGVEQIISSATSLTSDAERYLSGSGIVNTSRSRHFLVVNSAIYSHRLRRLGSTDDESRSISLLTRFEALQYSVRFDLAIGSLFSDVWKSCKIHVVLDIYLKARAEAEVSTSRFAGVGSDFHR